MKNLTFKAAMLNDSRTTVNRRSTDGQSQRHCKQTPLSKRWKVLMTLVFLFTFAIGNVWAENITITWPMIDGENATSQAGSASVANIVTVNNATLSSAYTSLAWSDATQLKYSTDGTTVDIQFYAGGVGITNNPTNNKTTVNSNCYVEFTFDVKTGYTFTPTGFSFKMGRKGTDEGTAQGVLTLADATTSSVEVYQPARTDKKVNFNAQEKEITGASAFSAGSTVTFRVYMGGKVGGKSLYLADVKVEGTYAVSGGGGSEPEEDTTAPTLASSVPVNSATNVAVSGNIVLTMSENVSIADASKFSISGGAGSLTTASITASGAAVTVPYAELANSTAYTLTVAKGALKDAAENENEAFTVAFTTAASLAEPDYVLVRNNGTLNTDDFITGGTFENNKSWKVGDVTYTSGLKFNNASSSLQFNDNGRFVAYNTKTDAAHVDIAVYNTNSSATVVKVAIIRENADGSLTLVQDAEYNLAARTGSSSSNYVYGYWTGSFDLTGRSTMYVYEKSNSGRIRICQMAVYETGSNNLAAPAIDYSVNLNKGRMFAAATTATTFEGLTYSLYSRYMPNNSTSAAIRNKGTEYISFTIPAGQARQLQVKASGSYNVSKTKGDESSYVSGNQNFNLTEGTWYINPNGSNVTITSIAFATAPTAYTVTYSKGDGSVKEGKTIPTQAATIEGGKFNVASGENLEKEGYDFAGWKYTPAVGDPVIYNAGQEFTMPAANVEFVAQWNVHETSDDATLGTLSVNGEAITIVPSQTVYAVELPFGTTAVPAVTATANDENVKAFTITQALAVDGSATIYVKAEDNTTEATYTINFTVADSKDLFLVFRTGTAACSDASTASAMLSDNAAVSSYINQITFNNVEGTGDNGKETGGGSGSLDVGKKAGNMLTLSAKPGYALQAMSFYGKIQDETCEYSLNGGAWQTLTSTGQSADKCYAVFADAEVHEFRLRSTGTSGVWIRNMELSIITACTPVKLNWTAEPAAEYEVGKAASAIAATANNGGAVAYSTTDGDVIAVNGSTGALTVSALGSVTLKAATAEGDGTAYCANGGNNIEISKAVNTYYLVKFDAQNTEAADEVKYYSGDAAIALPAAPSYPGYDFQGWFDAETGGNQYTAAITPSASMTVYAQWVAQCDGATITTQPTGANYITGRIPANLVCEATAGNGGALTYEWFTCDDALKTNPVAATATPSTAVVGTFYYFCKVTEAGCDVEAFSDVVTITVADKDPVCIIKATPTSATEATADGAYQGNAYFKGKAENKKLNSKYDYVAVQLMEGKSFLATDKVVLNQAADLGDASDITKFYVFTEVPADGKTYVTVDNAAPVKGDNWFDMPAEMAGESSLYIGRINANCNPSVGYLAVYRVMNPELTAITINGRDGEIDPLDDKHFYVTIPYEADLAALTVVPTIVSNTAEASVIKTVESNDGAWVLAENGDNTYRIKDKDGDYTDYTITLTRDVQKHAVKFYDGSTVYETLEVVDGESIAAGDVPADPTKEDYLFQGWAESTTGDVVDVTSFTISAAKNFYAKWEAEVAYRLIIDDTPSGKKINNVDFYTGVSLVATPVNIGGDNYYYTKVAGGAGSDVSAAPSGVSYNKDRVIAYNAKTTETKIKVTAYNKTTNNRSFRISFVEEGEAPADVPEDNVTIALPKDYSILNTDYYEFNSTKNRTIYITVPGSVDDCYFLQVKVVESGEDLKKAGEVGYSLNLNKGRMVGAKQVDQAGFEGFDFHYNNAYELLKSTSMVLNVKANDFVKFYAAAPMLLAVSADNAGVFHVTKDDKGEANETTAVEGGTVYVDLNAAGYWYLTPKGGDVKITNIAFLAPKCAEPAFNSLANSDLCGDASFEALNGTATVADAGTPIYQWYNADGDVEIEGATDAEYTPTADGSYYVIATNQLAGYTDNAKKSATVTVTHYASAAITTAPVDQYKEAGQNATLTVAASGKAPLSYQWYTCDENGDNAVIIAGAEAESYQVAVTAGMSQYYKVIVGSGCGSAEAVALVEEWSKVERANVTGSRTWDWSTAGMGEITLENGSEEYLMANVSSAVPNTEAFRSDMLLLTGTYANRGSSNKFFQGWQIRFYTEVPGKVSLNCRAIHETMSVTINGTEVEASKGSDMSTPTTPFFVPAGWVTIVFDNISTGQYADEAARLQKIVFNAEPDYTRDQMLGAGVYGTLCVDHNVPVAGINGATFYELQGRENTYGKLVFDEVVSGELTAGKPYVFQAHGDVFTLFYGATKVDNPVNSGGMYGTFEQTVLSGDDLAGVYYFAQKALWSCDGAIDLTIPANRAYVKLSEIDYLPANDQPAPGRRRVTMAVNGEKVATGVGEIEASETPMKVMIDGQLFIIRGEKMFDATGRLVK